MGRVAGSFTYNGAGANGATVRVYPLSAFGALPVGKGTTAPSAGLAVASDVTAETRGGDGAYDIGGIAPGEYYVAIIGVGATVYQYVAVPDTTASGSVLTNAGDIIIHANSNADATGGLFLRLAGVDKIAISNAGAITLTGATTVAGAINQTGAGATALSGALSVAGNSTFTGQVTGNGGGQFSSFLTATGLLTATASIFLNSAAPRLIIVDTAGGVDLKRWTLTATGATLVLQMLSDTSAITNVLVITRTSTYLTATLSIPAAITATTFSGALTVSGATALAALTAAAATFSGQVTGNGGGLFASFLSATGLLTATAGVLLNQASPRLIIHDSAGAVDTRRWDLTAETVAGPVSRLRLRMFNDTGTGTPVITWVRTATYTAATMTIDSAVSLVTVVGTLDVQNGIKLKTKAGAFTDADFPGVTGAILGGLNTLTGAWEFRDAAGNWQGIAY